MWIQDFFPGCHTDVFVCLWVEADLSLLNSCRVYCFDFIMILKAVLQLLHECCSVVQLMELISNYLGTISNQPLELLSMFEFVHLKYHTILIEEMILNTKLCS